MTVACQVNPGLVAGRVCLAADDDKLVAVGDGMAVCLEQQLVQRAVDSIRGRLQSAGLGVHGVGEVLRDHAICAVDADVEVVGWGRQRIDACAHGVQERVLMGLITSTDVWIDRRVQLRGG